MNKEETTMPAAEWLNKYESMKEKLACKTDLDAHFTEKVIGSMAVDVLDIGSVHFPTGTIFACDPLVELEDTLPFLQTIPAGTYPVKESGVLTLNGEIKIEIPELTMDLMEQLAGYTLVGFYMKDYWLSLETAGSSRWPMSNLPGSSWKTFPRFSEKRRKSCLYLINRQWRNATESCLPFLRK